MKRGGVAGGAGALFLAALLFRGGIPSPAPRTDSPGTQEVSAPATSSTQESGKKKKRWPEDGPWKASRQHFAGREDNGKCPSLKNEAKSKDVASLSGVTLQMKQAGDAKDFSNPRQDVWCIPDAAEVRAMIAIAPDPVHSHLSLVFDRTVEALQLAAETTDYVVDRYWLPWQPDLPAYPLAQAEPQDITEREKQPGLLLFRWNGPVDSSKPEVLYVFLVSDTSTAGINGTQFRNAVEYVQQVHPVHDPDRIWIMGPTFSGSLASLRALTAPPKELPSGVKWPSFTAYSGTVSSICAIANQGLLGPDTPAEKQAYPCVSAAAQVTPPPKLTFRSLVSDSETVVKKFIDMLKSDGAIDCDHPEIAILSEAATSYGSATSNKKECSTTFRYPREISSLRNASVSSEQRPAAPPQSGVVSIPTYLPFNLADRQPNSGDEPPDFSRVQGPLSKEAVLMKYAAELRRGHYKYAGIIGTNVVDVLFLAGFLRKACPDVRLFVLSSDLLLERDQDNTLYIGTVSLNTYPLLGRNLEWTSPGQHLQRLPFADEYQQGLFNAALLVMRGVAQAKIEPPPLYEVREPFGKPSSTFAVASSTLPVWVTVVGTGGYWPVRLLNPQPAPANDVTGVAKPAADAAAKAADCEKAPQMDGHDFSPAWRAITILLVGLGALQSLMLVTVSPWAARFREFSLINAAPAQRFFFINAASATLAFTLAILATPAWKFGMQADHHVPGIAMAAVVAIAMLAFSSLSLAWPFNRIRRREQQAKANWAWAVSMLFSTAAWLGAAIAWLLWRNLHCDDLSRYGFFFGYRTANLATGVSPFTPMLPLLCAVFLWAIFEIWRLRFDDQVRPRLNITNHVQGQGKEALIACSINRYPLRGVYLAAFVFLFSGWLFSLALLHPFQLFEKHSFGLLYESLFCVVVALVLSSSLRLAQTWSGLHNFLHGLERSPIRYAFNRLKLGSWSPIWQSGGQEQEWTSMARSFEVLQQIHCDQPIDAGLGRDIKKALDKGRRIGEGFLSRRLTLAESLSELQGQLATVFNDIITDLRKRWEKQANELDESDAGKEEKTVVVHCCDEAPDLELKKVRRLEKYAALRYVAFIRAVLDHVRHWLILQAALFSLVLISLNVYCFEPHRSLIWSLTVVFVIIGAIAIQVLMQAHRDPVLSRITGTQPNELGLHFFLRMATLGAVPILTLLATHFPSIGRYLLSFFQPGLEALK